MSVEHKIEIRIILTVNVWLIMRRDYFEYVNKTQQIFSSTRKYLFSCIFIISRCINHKENIPECNSMICYRIQVWRGSVRERKGLGYCLDEMCHTVPELQLHTHLFSFIR